MQKKYHRPPPEVDLTPSQIHPETNNLAFLAVLQISAKIVVTKVSPQPQNPCSISPNPEMSSEEKFRAAVRVIHSLPKDGNDKMLPNQLCS